MQTGDRRVNDSKCRKSLNGLEAGRSLEERIEELRNAPTSSLHQPALTGRRARSARQPEGLIGSIRRSINVSQRPLITFLKIIATFVSPIGF